MGRLRIEKRTNPSARVVFGVSILSIFLAFFVIGFIFLGYGLNPLTVYLELLVETVGNVYGITQIIWQSIPLLLCGVGLLIAFKASFWNIGAEGQLLMGAVSATWAALFSGLPNFLLIRLHRRCGMGASVYFLKGEVPHKRGHHYTDDELHSDEHRPLPHPRTMEG